MHLEFGAFLAPHHPLGEHPTLQFRRDIEFAALLDRLGFEGFLGGEERFSYDSEWFTLRDAELQILPVQRDMPVTVASSISPSGMQLAGKYGIGALSIASTSTDGIQALPTQWGFAEESAALHGQTV